MLPATVFGFRLKRSIPLHLAWWYFYVNLPNITGNPENASHSKKKRSIRSSLANLLPHKDLTNSKILISYHSNDIISLFLCPNNIRREQIKPRSLQWILKLSLWWISFKMTPHLWWSSWYPFLWSQWAPPDDRDDHEALLMIRVIPPLMIKVVRTKEPPLCFVAGSPPPSSCTKLALRVHNGPSCVNGWNILAPNSPAKMLSKKLDSLRPHHLDHSDGRLKLRKILK